MRDTRNFRGVAGERDRLNPGRKSVKGADQRPRRTVRPKIKTALPKSAEKDPGFTGGSGARMAKILERRKRLYFTGRSSLPERRVEATGSKAASATSSISQSHRAESEFRD